MSMQSGEYSTIRNILNSLGFHQFLPEDGIPLVNAILMAYTYQQNELITFQCKAQDALEKLYTIQEDFGALREDHARLTHENNGAKHKLEQYQREICGLKAHISELEKSYSELELVNLEYINKVFLLEEQILHQNENLEKFTHPSKYNDTQKDIESDECKTPKKSISSESVTVRTKDELPTNIEDLKFENVKLLESLEFYKQEASSGDEEIKSLTGKHTIFENASSLSVFKCTCHVFDVHDQISELTDQEKNLKLEEAQMKLHSLLSYAVYVAEKVEGLKRNIFTKMSSEVDDFFCLCRTLGKLQSVVSCCKANMSNISSENRFQLLKVKVEQLVEMYDKIGNENMKLREELEECKAKEAITDKTKGGIKTETQSTSSKDIAKTSSRFGGAISRKTGLQNKISTLSDNSDTSASNDLKTIKSEVINCVDALLKSNYPSAESVHNLEDRLNAMAKELEEVKQDRDYLISKLKEMEKAAVGEIHKQEIQENPEYTLTEEENKYKYEEVRLLKQKIEELKHAYELQIYQTERAKFKLQESINYLAEEKTSNYDLKEQIKTLEGTLQRLSVNFQNISSEKSHWQAEYLKIRSSNDHLERSLKNADVLCKKMEHDLLNVVNKENVFKLEKAEMINEIAKAQKEAVLAIEKLQSVMKEKEDMTDKVDFLEMQVNNLERDKKKNFDLIQKLDEEISRLNCEIGRYANEEQRVERNVSKLKKEYELVKEENIKLKTENSKLASNLEALIKDIEIGQLENENYRMEIFKLKEQLQKYVEEVRRVEQILEIKENEREEMLEQFKALSAEAVTLESTNRTLASEKESTNKELEAAQRKLQDLAMCEIKKDTFVFEEIKQISSELAQSQQLKSVTSQFKEHPEVTSSLESDISSSRNEVPEDSPHSFSIQQEVSQLRDMVEELQEKLSQVNNALSKCQSNCEKYKNENIYLRRELVSEKSKKTKTEETQSFSTSI